MLPLGLSSEAQDRLLAGLPNGQFKDTLKTIYQYYIGSRAAVEGFRRILVSTDPIDPAAIQNALRNETIRYLEDTARKLDAGTHYTQKESDDEEASDDEDAYTFEESFCNPALIDAFLRNAFPSAHGSDRAEQERRDAIMADQLSGADDPRGPAPMPSSPSRRPDARSAAVPGDVATATALLEGAFFGHTEDRPARRPSSHSSSSSSSSAASSASTPVRGASESEYDYLRKVLLVGSSGSQKSRVYRLLNSDISRNTIGVEFTCVTVNGIKYQVWDTAGQERFKSITTSYYRNANIVFCFVNSESDVRNWKEELKEHLPARALAYFVTVGDASFLSADNTHPYEVLTLREGYSRDDVVGLITQAGRQLLSELPDDSGPLTGGARVADLARGDEGEEEGDDDVPRDRCSVM